MPAHPSRRNGPSEFDPNMFYTLRPLSSPQLSLSSSSSQESKASGLSGTINIIKFNTSSSENWQIFYQSGRYFIRNYDWNPSWQLCLSEDKGSRPKMDVTSGSIGHQWSVNKVDGGWTLMNGLLGNTSSLSLSAQGPAWGAIMGSDSKYQVWNITANPR
jgi:hypothetical protein